MTLRFLRPHTLAACIATCLTTAGLAATNLPAVDLSATAIASQSALAGGTAQAGPVDRTSAGRYIVRFSEPALAAHNRALRASAQAKGQVQTQTLGVGVIPYRIQASGRARLDTQSSEARAYTAALATQQDQHKRSIESAVNRSVPFLRTYRHALNGAVMVLTPAEAAQVRRLPGVASIVPDRGRAPADDVSTRFIGASSVWLNAVGTDPNPGYTFPTIQSLFGQLNTPYGFKGDGVVVGDIDTGYNSLSPSFQATDASGYTITNPLGSGTYLGDCSVPGISLGGCNDKVIGVYDEVSTTVYNRPPVSVEDTQGHGSHTASTTAGNARTATTSGYPANISGIAPHANLVIFYACAPSPVLCQDSATAGSVDDAIADGAVEVINFSISGGTRPWNDPVSQAFLAAEDAGIFVAAAAGNTGTSVPLPLPGTVNHLEPWVTTVAATTDPVDAIGFLLKVKGANGAIVLNPAASGVTLQSAVVDEPIVASPTFTSAGDGCTAFPANTFKGATALIQYDNNPPCGTNTRAGNAVAAGANHVIIVANTDGGFLSGANQPVPVWTISLSDGTALYSYVSAQSKPTISVGYPASRFATKPDVLADFSLIGPASFDLIKPDISAPGVNILAAFNNATLNSKGELVQTNGPEYVGLDSGTSMATPHITGVAALLVGLHPHWSPMEIKSAITMTAEEHGLTKADAATSSDFYDRGAGRVAAYQAAHAGLVLDETSINMVAAYPDGGGDPSTLNLASLQNSNCAGSCTFTRTLTSTQAGSVTWTAGTLGDLAGNITVTPTSFTVAEGGTVTLTIKVNSAGLTPGDGYHFGEVILSPPGEAPVVSISPGLHLPVAIAVPEPRVTAAANAVNIALNGKPSGSATLALSNPGVGTMLFKPQSGGMAPFTWLDQANDFYYGERSTHYTALSSGDTDYYSADDFVITGNGGVDLSSIVAPGFSINHTLASFGASLPVHWRIYADSNGFPASDPVSGGAAVWSYDATAGSTGVDVSGDTISLDLAAAGQSTALPAGHYWLVVYPELPCKSSTGRCTEGWDWINSWRGSGAVWANIQPQAGGSNQWDNTNDEQAGFGLALTLTTAANCSIPSWLGVTPDFGAVGSTSTTNITFSATAAGYAPASSATAYVCLGTSYQSDIGTIVPRAVVPVQVNANN